MSLKIILLILFIHWFADFVLQTDKQAKGKSKNWKDLLSHTINYSLVWIIPIFLISYFYNGFTFIGAIIISLLFSISTFICHTSTDYVTSRLNSKLYAKGDIHNFFVSIGFDQFLHYVQLLLTLKLLS